MKKMKKVVKRDIYKHRPVEADVDRTEITKDDDSDDCSGTAIAYCNQWECYTRFICLEEESDKKGKIDST